MYMVLGVISNLETTASTREGVCRFYLSITPFYSRDLSICGFWCLWGILEPTPCEHRGTTAHNLFTHSFVGEHLGCLHLLAIMSNSAVNICVQVSLWTYCLFSLGYIPRSAISESYGDSKFNCVRNCLFSAVAAPFSFLFIHIFTNTCYFPFSFIKSILVDVK